MICLMRQHLKRKLELVALHALTLKQRQDYSYNSDGISRLGSGIRIWPFLTSQLQKGKRYRPL